MRPSDLEPSLSRFAVGKVSGVALLTALLTSLPTVPAGAQGLWCDDADDVYATVDGDSVTVHHDATVYNCCPAGFHYDVDEEASVIHVLETEILDTPCFCLCCYNLSVGIKGVAPGDHEIVFRWWDYETDGPQERSIPIHVPDAGQTGELAVGVNVASECLDTASIPEPEEPRVQPTTWGNLKVIYR